ncbi:ABC transporter G family protein [Cavenderia fasciculata]|uniref:ABC transporter G family protein n=1 Tax=Cavenderia fasciculata TaxID=261658 RepID=F4PI69_CACFS|nr:ABC transporter G family protein [Cavenderia fasciculata]EGG25352.1 ABC transporter G family protein [Cavenderia fasciculata]|eukprot:XP_004363203.1 ABC transporter G family protein [Cavenderia fasciculata]
MVESTEAAVSIENVSRGAIRLWLVSLVLIHRPNILTKSYYLYLPTYVTPTGKTTLLKIILGRLIPDSGRVLVFGKEPHSAGHTVPGSDVGYAPQETALYDDLSIAETLQFHATLHGMDDQTFKERKAWIMTFLDLPPESRIVGTLSGGQKRRVSLSVALLHGPKMLILDEPSVGVDPLVRSKIWNYLREIALSGVTVIVTTHYIEEARMADRVAFMRHGSILEEGVPDKLMRKYKRDTLEDVFLLLCKSSDQSVLNQDNNNNSYNNNLEATTSTDFFDVMVSDNNNKDNNNNNNSKSPDNNSNGLNSENEEIEPMYSVNDNYDLNEKSSLLNHKDQRNQFTKNLQQVMAMAKRKLTQIFRNKVVLSFELLSPTFQIVLFFICIGSTPKNLNFAVVNNDIGMGAPFNLNLGTQYISFLSQSPLFEINYFNNTIDAVNSIKNGYNYGAMIIPENFTSTLPLRFQDPTDTALVNQSNINLYLDYSNYQIVVLIEQQMQLSFEAFGESYNMSLNPIIMEPPVYGTTSTNLLSFLAPGMISLIIFAHSIAITAVSFVKEKSDGSLDRIYAIGVNTKIIIAGHFLGHMVLLIVQTTVLMLITIFGFKVPIQGDLALVIAMIMLLGSVGMGMGLVISSVSTQETEAIQLSLATYFPTLLLSGVIAPLESIPKWFIWASYGLPTTWAAKVLRDLMIKGSSFVYRDVWKGFLIVISWAIFVLTLSTFLMKSKQSNSSWFKKKSN